jgi:sugar lactone lactonase YvrE
MGRLVALALLLTAQDYPQDMPLSRVLVDGEGWQLVGEGYQFTEGPAVDREGNVYFTDIPASRIHKAGVDGRVSVFLENSAKTNGLMVGPDGRLYGCRMGEKKIVAYGRDGAMDVLAEEVDSNDLVVNSKGEVWFTDPPGGRIWHIPVGGKARTVAEKLRPNGLILTPDEGTLVVTDSQEPVLWAFRVGSDGSLSSKDRYYQPLRRVEERPGTGADGLTFDAAGRIYVATRAGIQMFDPTGRLGGVIAKPHEKGVSNVVFGGPDFSWLYVTATDKVFRRKTKSPGAPYFLRAK